MNILVTGANGQLGNEIRLAVAAAPSLHRFIFSDISPETEESLETLRRMVGDMPSEAVCLDTTTFILDITKAEDVRNAVEQFDIGCIVNCAAYTNVDGAESNEASAALLNAHAPAILAEAMHRTGGLLIHISTDYVFGGLALNTPCNEDVPASPTGVYGRTKLQGEKNVASTLYRSIIIRTSWLYSEFGKNFCRTMLSLTASKPSLNVVFDQIGTPTYAADLAQAVLKVIANPVAGIYHFSNEGVCSWYDFAKAVQIFDNDIRFSRGESLSLCRINPCHSCEFPSPVKRPAYSVLDKTRIKTTFAIDIPYWIESLRKCIGNIKL